MLLRVKFPCEHGRCPGYLDTEPFEIIGLPVASREPGDRNLQSGALYCGAFSAPHVFSNQALQKRAQRGIAFHKGHRKAAINHQRFQILMTHPVTADDHQVPVRECFQ
ncbi:hypothetical protein C7E19_22250 [Stenotrophomonas maltophilia]|nr:hypothetical protein C7E19_22250 [Stenotrophomonas maltophilia]